MLIAELIELLKTYPQDAVAVIHSEQFDGFYPVTVLMQCEYPLGNDYTHPSTCVLIDRA